MRVCVVLFVALSVAAMAAMAVAAPRGEASDWTRYVMYLREHGKVCDFAVSVRVCVGVRASLLQRRRWRQRQRSQAIMMMMTMNTTW
jgi:hypothetical protein